jgi:hypothetical protein
VSDGSVVSEEEIPLPSDRKGKGKEKSFSLSRIRKTREPEVGDDPTAGTRKRFKSVSDLDVREGRGLPQSLQASYTRMRFGENLN